MLFHILQINISLFILFMIIAIIFKLIFVIKCCVLEHCCSPFAKLRTIGLKYKQVTNPLAGFGCQSFLKLLFCQLKLSSVSHNNLLESSSSNLVSWNLLLHRIIAVNLFVVYHQQQNK